MADNTLPDTATKPVRTLSCTCCGSAYRGRQFWNQDTGHGLGDCCVEFATRGMSEAAIRETYGVRGVHFCLEARP